MKTSTALWALAILAAWFLIGYGVGLMVGSSDCAETAKAACVESCGQSDGARIIDGDCYCRLEVEE